jgi:hypothetical protein
VRIPGEVQIRVALESPRSQARVEKSVRMNEIAFHVLYERTARPLSNYLLRVSGRRDIAEDVLQESYCRLLSAKLPEMDEAQTRSYLIATIDFESDWAQLVVPDRESWMETVPVKLFANKEFATQEFTFHYAVPPGRRWS